MVGQGGADIAIAKLALMNGQALAKAYVPLPAGATAVYTSSSTVHHYRFPDWLGSSRVSALATGTSHLYFDGAYAPYGESYATTGTSDFSFTEQNQDTNYNLYDFPFREYDYGLQGRWTSPDPAGLAAVNSMNPQSWNRYTYALSDPTGFVDPTGLFGEPAGCAPNHLNRRREMVYVSSDCVCIWDSMVCAVLAGAGGVPGVGGGTSGGGGSAGGPTSSTTTTQGGTLGADSLIGKLPCIPAEDVPFIQQALLDLFNSTFGTHLILGIDAEGTVASNGTVTVRIPIGSDIPVSQIPSGAGPPGDHPDYGHGIRFPISLPGSPADQGHIVFNTGGAPNTIKNAEIHGDIGGPKGEVLDLFTKALWRHVGQMIRENTTQRNPGCPVKFADSGLF